MDERERVLVTLAGMRALMGVLWLSQLLDKLPTGFGRHDRDGLMQTFHQAEQHALIGPLRDLVRRLVIPHFTVFGWLVFAVELTAGLLLVAGFHTRAGALIGLVVSLVMVAFLGPTPHTWSFALFLLVAWHLVLLATPCARRLSFDDRLGRDP